MPKFSRPFMALVLIMVMLSAALPACGSTTPAAPSPAPAQPTAAPAAPAAAAPTVAPPASTSAAPAPAAATAAPAAAAPTAAPKPVTTYNITRLTDMSGPVAAQAKYLDAGASVAIAYWNDTAGKDLGIKLNAKAYDTRFDASQTASLWPGVLGSDKPIAVQSLGSPNVAALAERLPTDKVPLFNPAGGTVDLWRSGAWAFHMQTTYAHQTVGFLDWRLANWKESRPIRLGVISSQQSATLFDMVKGIESIFQKGKYAGKVDYIGVEWVPYGAPEVANEMKRLLDKKPDYIASNLPSVTVVSIKRALQQYKADTVKMLFYGSGGLDTFAKAMTMNDFEGDFEVNPYASSAETDIEGAKIFQQYRDKVGAGDIPWTATTESGMVVGMVEARAIERAARAVGVDKVTGEAVYNATLAGPFTTKDLVGLAGDIAFTKDAAYPIANIKVRISTVKDGRFQLATSDWIPVSAVEKW